MSKSLKRNENVTTNEGPRKTFRLEGPIIANNGDVISIDVIRLATRDCFYQHGIT